MTSRLLIGFKGHFSTTEMAISCLDVVISTTLSVL